MSQWQSAAGGESKIVRWHKEASDDVAAKTVYVGDTVQGIYIQKKEDIGKKKGVLYVIRTEQHGDLAVWGQTVLNNAFEESPCPKIGDEVRISFLGKATTKDGEGEYNNYAVDFRTPEVPMQSATGAQQEAEAAPVEEDGLPPM